MRAEGPQQSSRDAARSGEATTGSGHAARELLEERRTANGIYGIIVGTAVMGAAYEDGVGELAVEVLVTLVIYWAAERYAHVMARRMVLGRGLMRAELGGELSQGWELVTASFAPLAVLVGANVLGAGLEGSVLSAMLCSTALLALTGWRVGREAQMGLVQCLLSAALAGAFGVAMIALKTLMH